tara:strand:- start:702 stop:1451 length:750 start_codon:yes stop_codon:yes gene_type:complete
MYNEENKWLWSETDPFPEDATQDLNALGLPAPKFGSYLPGYQGRLMFLDDYGLVIRVESQSTIAHNHPHILQPLCTINRPLYRIEVCPAIEVISRTLLKENFGACSYHLQNVLNDLLKHQGMELWDFQLENCGLLPDPDQDGKLKPVVLDRNAVRKNDRYKTSAPPSAFSGQAVFKPLSNAFHSAVEFKDDEKLKFAYQLARQMKEKGTLISSWQKVTLPACKTGKAAVAGRAYAPNVRNYQKNRSILP